MSRGFTLMEVLVALAVLGAGTVALERYLEGFARLRTMEQERVRELVLASKTVEDVVRNPPRCGDTLFNEGPLEVTLKAVPGVRPLAWVQCESRRESPVRLRRLVRCRNK